MDGEVARMSPNLFARWCKQQQLKHGLDALDVGAGDHGRRDGSHGAGGQGTQTRLCVVDSVPHAMSTLLGTLVGIFQASKTVHSSFSVVFSFGVTSERRGDSSGSGDLRHPATAAPRVHGGRVR